VSRLCFLKQGTKKISARVYKHGLFYSGGPIFSQMTSYTYVEILVEKFGRNILVVQFQLIHSNSGYLQETVSVGCNGLHKIIIP